MSDRPKLVLLLVLNNAVSLVLTIVVGLWVNLATGASLSRELDPFRRFLVPLALLAAIASSALSARLLLLDRRERRSGAAGPSWGNLHGRISVGGDIRTGAGSSVKAVDASSHQERMQRTDRDGG